MTRTRLGAGRDGYDSANSAESLNRDITLLSFGSTIASDFSVLLLFLSYILFIFGHAWFLIFSGNTSNSDYRYLYLTSPCFCFIEFHVAFRLEIKVEKVYGGLWFCIMYSSL